MFIQITTPNIRADRFLLALPSGRYSLVVKIYRSMFWNR